MGGARRVAGLAMAMLVLRTAAAGARTLGAPCAPAVDRCERWWTAVQGPPTQAGQRPDEFPAEVVVSGRTVYVGVKAVPLDIRDPYASSGSWAIAAYDLASGAERWRVFRRSRAYDSLLDLAVSPDGRTVVATGGAYDGFPVGTATDSRIVTVAFDAATGAERWAATWDARPDGTDNGKVVAFAPDSRLVFVGGITTATAGDLDYVTLAFDARTGKRRWAQVYRGLGTGGVDALYDLAASPGGDRVYVTGESAGAREFDLDYATVAYDTRKGKQAWASRQDRGGVDRAGALAVDGDRVFVTGDSYVGPGGADFDALTVALRAADGTVAWEKRLGGAGYDAGRALVAGGGRVIVTTQSPGASSDEGLDALTAAYDTASGAELWRTRLAEPRRSELANDLALSPGADIAYLIARSRPAIQHTALDEQVVVAFRVADGSTVWTTHLDAGVGNAFGGDAIAATLDTVVTLGQRTRSADPLGPPDQDVYDTLVVALDA
jgi:hypothetical protein